MRRQESLTIRSTRCILFWLLRFSVGDIPMISARALRMCSFDSSDALPRRVRGYFDDYRLGDCDDLKALSMYLLVRLF